MEMRAVLRLCAGLAMAGSVLCGNAVAATERGKVEAEFRRWLDTDIRLQAKRAQISSRTLDQALGGIRLDWSLPDLATKKFKSQRQSEFRSPAAYFKQSRLSSLARAGRKHLAKWDRTLGVIEQRYGVPRRIIIAIWARESDFGRAKLPHNAIRALATEAFMGRRKAFFRPELLAALKIVDQGHISAGRMKSSWAGALGHPQFLPSKFLKFAVDFDGDGRRDIWNSVPDALASIANYLRQHGWQSGRDWGFEANVPAKVACTLEGPDKGGKIADWVRLGVTRVSGRPFPQGELGRKGFLLMPAGRLGPAFIATPNFFVLKTYNESDLYALFIGHLADRFGADRPFVGKWRKTGGFNRRDVQLMQQRLEKKGHDVGGADGLVGFRTRVAVGLWQVKTGRSPTCFPDAGLVRSIR
jgi:lytic murein transglycosylase